MKEFINYLSNHGVNFNVIITDIDFWVIIILIVAASEVIRRVRILTREYDEIFKKLLSAESKIEDKCAELFASSHINDCLSVENSLLKQRLENAERKLLKYNFKRDNKGKFVSPDPYYYAKNIAKRKKWFTDRIGKIIYATKFCTCDICQSNYESGLIVSDELLAVSFFDTENDLQSEGAKLKYFDTKEERTQYEIENNLKQ